MFSASTIPASAAQPGARFIGVVTRVRPYAITVRLPALGDRKGVVRRRELAWELPYPDPTTVYHEGDELTLIVLSDPGSGLLELSLRQAIVDPWKKWAPRLRVGQVVRGSVVHLREFGAFVEIKPGLHALLPLEDVAPWRIDKIEDALWVDDLVEVVITRVESSRHRLQVSLRARLEQLASGRTAGEKPQLLEATPDTSIQVAPLQPDVRMIRRVLVVDDDDSLREPMLDLLRRTGRDADGAANPEAGAAAGTERRYDAVLMDIHFSTTPDGVEAGRRILADHPSTLLVFMTGLPMTEEDFDRLWEAGAAEVVRKPFAEDDILELLTRLERGEVRPLARTGSRSYPAIQSTQEEVTTTAEYALLAAELADLRQRVGADAAAIFKMDLQTHKVTRLASMGVSAEGWQRSHDLVAKSPIGDVILGRESIQDRDVKGRRVSKYTHLLTLLDFDSCIALPLPVEAQPLEHALFLFWSAGRTWSAGSVRQARLAAARLGVMLERASWQEKIIQTRRLSLAGELSVVLAHEVNGKLSGMEIRLANLTAAAQGLDNDGQAVSSDRLAHLKKELATLRTDMTEVLGRVRDFQRLMQSAEPGLIDVNAVVRHAVHNLQSLALNRYKVTLTTELARGLPLCLGEAAKLDHACQNLILNALEWVRRKPATGGTVQVRTGLAEDRRRLWIRVQGDGCGIHRRLLPRLFEFGFTTRENEGTGLGLYVTRLFVEQMGGSVNVEQSLVLLGATFRIDLPVDEEVGSTHA